MTLVVNKTSAAAFATCAAAVCVGTASASTPTLASWARGANRICAAELTQVHGLPKPVADYLPEAQYLDRSASIVGAATLSTLPRPAASRSAISRWIALEWQGVRHVRQIAAAFRTHDLAAAQSIGSADKPRSARADAIAIHLGATICAQP
jgi:hypothetical protein